MRTSSYCWCRFSPLLVVLWLAAMLSAQGVGPKQKPPDLLPARIEQLARSFPGKIGVFARVVETGEEVGYNQDDLFPMASTYKIPIMVAVFRQADAGRISLEDRVTITKADQRLGSGLLAYMTPGLNPTVHDLVLMMMSVSDNEATDLLLHRVPVETVSATMRQLGIKDLRVDRTTQEILRDWMTYVDPSAAQKPVSEGFARSLIGSASREKLEEANRAFTDDLRDHASPRAMTDLLTKLVRFEAASERSCRDMLNIMRQQQPRDRIPRYLENVPIAAKNGTIQYTTNDAGVIYAGPRHIALTIYTLKANSSVPTEEAQDRIGRMARTIYDYFQDIAPER